MKRVLLFMERMAGFPARSKARLLDGARPSPTPGAVRVLLRAGQPARQAGSSSRGVSARWKSSLALCLGGSLLVPVPLAGGASWQEELQRMPLAVGTTNLNRDNCVGAMLNALQSNATVKALIFLPGVADDFYLLNRDRPKLGLAASNLLEAVIALTNATAMRLTVRPPFLLLHTSADLLQPALTINSARAAAQLKGQSGQGVTCYVDAHWDNVQPVLERVLTRRVLPRSKSEDAWHFHRHNLAGWQLTHWELVEAMALAGRTHVTIERKRLVFRVDSRLLPIMPAN